MTKSNGIASLKQAAKLLNKHAPDGESLAYINPTEARILKAYGGSGIMTLSGVPSYEWWNPFSWNWTGDEGIIDKAGDFLGYGKQTVLDESGKAVEVAGRSPFQDAISIYAALRAKKDQEGLNAAEMSEFNRLNQQLTAGREEFKGYTGGGEHLTAPTNVPETIEDVSVFTETTGRPDMITTGQAQGGRIGYNLGGIDRPFQGIGALNPRMGYEGGTHPLDDVAMQMFGMTFENLNPLQQITVSQSQSKAYGGRIGAQKGGIMPLLNLGGMEKDYRQDGGFVPIGRREKADDVPARLSKNEFVFTADAVKAAGGGDIDQGAQRMYNVMKNLEAGGEISEQSQGQA